MEINESLAKMLVQIPPPTPPPTRMRLEEYIKLLEVLNSNPEKYEVVSKAMDDYIQICSNAAETLNKIIHEVSYLK
jgi:hypothetical protein